MKEQTKETRQEEPTAVVSGDISSLVVMSWVWARRVEEQLHAAGGGGGGG